MKDFIVQEKKIDINGQELGNAFPITLTSAVFDGQTKENLKDTLNKKADKTEIPTDTVTSTQLSEVKSIAESKVSADEVDVKLENYTPTSNIKTLNGMSLTDGPGNIEISGGEDLSNIEHFTPSYDGTWLYINEYYGKNCIIDFPDLSNNGSILFNFNDSRCTYYFKIPDTWNGSEAYDPYSENTTGPTQFVKNVWYKVENYPTYRTIDIMSENPNSMVSEDRVNQLIDERGYITSQTVDERGYITSQSLDERGYQVSANIKTLNGMSLTDGPGNIEISGNMKFNNWVYRDVTVDEEQHKFIRWGEILPNSSYYFTIIEEAIAAEAYLSAPALGIPYKAVVYISGNETGKSVMFGNSEELVGGDENRYLYQGHTYLFECFGEDKLYVEDITQPAHITYNPENIKTVNGQSLTDGPGNIQIMEPPLTIEHFTPQLLGGMLYVRDYSGINCIIDFPEEAIASNNINLYFGNRRYTCYFKIPDSWKGESVEITSFEQTAVGNIESIKKNVWYKVDNFKTYYVIDIISEPPQSGISEDRVNQLIDANTNGYAKSSELSTVATTGSYNDLIDKPNIPTDTVTSTQLSEVRTLAESKTDMSSVQTYITEQGFAKTSELPEPIVVDDTMSETSTNPVQNRILNDKLSTLQNEVASKTDMASVEAKDYATNASLTKVATDRNIKAIDKIAIQDPQIPIESGVTPEVVQDIINQNTAGFQNEQGVKDIIKTNPEGFAKVSEIPTDTVTSAQLSEVRSLAEGKISPNEVDTKLESYNPTTNFKTVGGISIIGTGDIPTGTGGVTEQKVQEIINSNTAGFQTASQVDEKVNASATTINSRIDAVDASIPTNVETFTFTLKDGTTVTKNIFVDA